MEIQKYYYNEDYKMLYVEYIDGDDDNSIELEYNDILIYSPQVITEEDLNEIDEDFVLEIVQEYLKSL